MTISEERLTQAILEYDDALMASLPDPSECKHVFSDSFERKMKKLIRKADHYVAYKVMRCVASFLIAFLVSASLVLSLNPEARAAVVNWIKEYANGVYNYFFTAEEVESTEDYVLGWIPDGYQLVDSFEFPAGKTFNYQDEEGKILTFVYTKGYEDISFTTGNNYYEEKRIVEGSFHADLYIALQEDKSNAITWISQNESIIFTISAFENEVNMVKMAKSVELE